MLLSSFYRSKLSDDFLRDKVNVSINIPPKNDIILLYLRKLSNFQILMKSI